MANKMTNKEAREILIQDKESLKANPKVTVDDCLYEALDTAIKALEFVEECERWAESFTRSCEIISEE